MLKRNRYHHRNKPEILNRKKLLILFILKKLHASHDNKITYNNFIKHTGKSEPHEVFEKIQFLQGIKLKLIKQQNFTVKKRQKHLSKLNHFWIIGYNLLHL